MSAENIRNTYRRQGAQAERERIIKLLEGIPECNCNRGSCFTTAAVIEEAIAKVNEIANDKH